MEDTSPASRHDEPVRPVNSWGAFQQVAQSEGLQASAAAC
jgi:hypothetical protein